MHNLKRIDALLTSADVVSAGRVEWFEEIDSTNSWLMQQRANYDIHGSVCLAELQTAGRGRRGHTWHAPRSSSVLLSLGWRLVASDSAGLSLVSGLAIVAALRHVGVASVGLKWPNDVMVREQKLGGVLTELCGEYCVVGMGINIAIPPFDECSSTSDSFTGKLPDNRIADMPRTDLKSLGYSINRDALAAALIIAHCNYLRRFGNGGFAQFVDEWNALNVHRDCAVSVESPAASYHGIVRGVGCDGALSIDCDGTQRRLISGEMRVRPLNTRMHHAP